MKKLVAYLLSFALFFTCADMTVFAAPAHDAYDAWQDLLDGLLSDITDKIKAYEDMIKVYDDLRGEYQNQDDGHDVFEWNVPTTIAHISTNPGNRSDIQYFHQTGIQANAQFKAGSWLDNNTYDATAGMPTTENFFLTVGGTQYIIDVSYEFVSRPYVRRLWFHALNTPNYRYYKVGNASTLNISSRYIYDTTMTMKWDTNVIEAFRKYSKNRTTISGRPFNWQYTSLTAMNHQWHLQPNTTGDALVPFTNPQGGDGKLAPSANGYNIVSTLLSAGARQESIDNTLAAGWLVDNKDWYKCSVDATPNEDTMSPDILTAVETKRQLKEIINDFKTQFSNLDDNYRADQGAWDADNPDYNSANYAVDILADKTYWNYTYYALVRHSSNAHCYNGSVPSGASNAAFGNEGYSSPDLGISRTTNIPGKVTSNRYVSDNPWDPIIVTYQLEWQGFGHAGINQSASKWKDFYSPTYKPALLQLGSNCCNKGCPTWEDFVYNHIIYPNMLLKIYDGAPDSAKQTQYLTAGKFKDGNTISKDPNVESLSGNHFSLMDHYYDYFYRPAYFSYGADANSLGQLVSGAYGYIPADTTRGDYCFMGNAPFVKRMSSAASPLFETEDYKAYMANNYLAALNAPDAIYLPGLPSDSNFFGSANGIPDLLQNASPTSGAFSDQESQYAGSATPAYNYTSSSETFNQLACVYYTHIYNLFCNVSGLFYYDELVDLFEGFPGLDISTLSPGSYNDKVAANLYLMFGGSSAAAAGWYYSEDVNYATIDYIFSVPWACFPPGGDLDGNMEDITATKVNAGVILSGFASSSMGDNTPAFGTTTKSYDTSGLPWYNSWDVIPVETSYVTLSNVMQRSPQYVKYTDYGLHICYDVDETLRVRKKVAVTSDYFLPNKSVSQPGMQLLPNNFVGTWLDIPEDKYDDGTWNKYYYKIHGTADKHWEPDATDTILICGDTNSLEFHEDCTWHPADCGCEGVPATGGWGNHTHNDGEDPELDPDGVPIPDTGTDAYDEFTACTEENEWHYHSPWPKDTPSPTTPEDNNHDMRPYKESLSIEIYTTSQLVNWDAEGNGGLDTTWTEKTKSMSALHCVEQKFEDVQYINILSWQIWALTKAECISLSSLLGAQVNLADNNGTQDANGVITTARNTVLNVIGYDLDEANIDATRGNVKGDKYWNNLELMGRVYNSYNVLSDGVTGVENVNNSVNHGVQVIPTNVLALPAAKYLSLATYRGSDTPYIKNKVGELINDDPAAYKLYKPKYSNGSDDLHFVYSALTQGGRSHSTFAGFVFQALAHSLCSSTGTDGGQARVGTSNRLSLAIGSAENRVQGLVNNSVANPYANSIRVQGDYLAVEVEPGVYVNIVGSMYDEHRNMLNLANKAWSTAGFQTIAHLVPNIVKYSQVDGFGQGKWTPVINSTTGSANTPEDALANDTERFALVQESNMPEFRLLKAYCSITPWIPGRLAYILGRTNLKQLTSGVYSPNDTSDVAAFAGDPVAHLKAKMLTTLPDCWVMHTYCYSINDAQYTFWDIPTNAESGIKSITGADVKLSSDRLQTLQGSINAYVTPDFSMCFATIDNWESTKVGQVFQNDHREYAIKYNANSTFWKPYIANYSQFGIGWANMREVRNKFNQDGYGPFNMEFTSDSNITPTATGANATDAISYTVDCDYMQTDHHMNAGGSYNPYSGFTEGVYFQRLGKLADTTRDTAPTWKNRDMGILTTVSLQLPVIGYQSEGIGVQSITKDGAEPNTQRGMSPYQITKFDPTWTMISAGYAGFEGWQGAKVNGFEQFGANLNSAVYTNARIDPGTTTTYTGNRTPDQLVSAAEFGRNYPWLQQLNLNRYLPNGGYYTGAVYAVYEKIASGRDSYADNIPVTTREDVLRVDAKYHQSPTSPFGTAVNRNDVANSLVVYNPVTTESAHIISQSKFLPDATNKGTDGYLSAYLQITLRDQRVAKWTGKNDGGPELIVDSTGNITSILKPDYNRYHYELKTVNNRVQSAEESKSYTMDDYDVKYNQSEVVIFGGSTEANYMRVEKNAQYKFSIQNRVGEWSSCTVNLEQGDTVSFQDNFLLLEKGSTLFELPYEKWQEAYKLLQESHGWEIEDTTNYVPIKSGQTFKPMDGTFNMSAGSVIKLQLYLGYDDTGIQPFRITNIDSNNFQWKTEHDNGVWTIYIEALNDAVLKAPEFAADIDFRVERYEGSAVTAANVVLMHIGTSHDFVEGITSISSYYERSDSSLSWIAEAGYYNSMVVDISGSWEIKGVNMTMVEVAYGSCQNGSVTVTLDESNPHKVPNTNWRYYVLGWRTADGEFITDINDAALAPGSTVELIPPIGISQEIPLTASYLDQLANSGLLQVGKYNGYYYLSQREDAYSVQYKLDWYGLAIERFDLISFGEYTTTQLGVYLTVELTSRTDITSYTYEEIFIATGTTVYEMAYTVQYSANIAHKYSQTSNMVAVDWDLVYEQKADAVVEGHAQLAANTLSLDDEFLIYWDNLTDLVPGSQENNNGIEQRQLSPTLGRGWDVQIDDIKDVDSMSQSLKTLLGDSRAKNGYEWWNTVLANGAGTLTDTTKWIYSKYVTFNVDMYGFTTGGSFTLGATEDPRNVVFNPTTPAFRDDGTPNNVVYIPAGTPVHLGYYNGDDMADNKGHFVDYGFENGNTNSPNGWYTYHFWVPLSVGESVNDVVVEYHVKSINANDTAAGQGSWNLPGVTKIVKTPVDKVSLWMGGTDEWGNKEILPGMAYSANNLNRVTGVTKMHEGSGEATLAVTRTTTELARPGNSVYFDAMSVVGRIGGLSVLDSGDPRWQDTFKYPSDKYAIAPLIFAVTRYSNKAPGSEEGTQRRYLTDLMDVRGRLWTGADGGYKLLQTLDVYLSQAWKNGASRFLLPMASGFNVHDAADLPTQQLGYELYLSLDTIGNYYGSSGKRGGEGATNYNNDYGQTKVQIRPVYYYFPADDSGNIGDPIPVDIYFKRNGNFVLLNAGSAYVSESTASGDAGPYYGDAASNAYYSVGLMTNTGSAVWNASTQRYDYVVKSGSTYVLDQTILRRMVTEIEAKRTYEVLYNIKSTKNVAVQKGVTTTILESNNVGSIDSDYMLDYKYYYGNPQILYLRERNRTFQGWSNDIINATGESAWNTNAQLYGQKWYFGLGLPASAVFVKHGEKSFTNETIINGKKGYILVTLDIYAIGEKWVLHYQSDISNKTITIGDRPFTAEKWNVLRDPLPNLIPVSIYDTEKMNLSDIDTRGTF